MSLTTQDGPPKLVTFDGDVTLYEDGQCLLPDSPVIQKILWLLKNGLCVGVVTAAGYTDSTRYLERLHGLLHAIRDSEEMTPQQKENLIILGGESSYMFRFAHFSPSNSISNYHSRRSCPSSPTLLKPVAREDWALKEMLAWSDSDIKGILDIAETSLRDSVMAMRLNATVIRKERAVGIVHSQLGGKFAREQLEEAVLASQKTLELSDVGQRLPFCAFNGGNDVFVDIGDKRLGVLCCQRFFGDVTGAQTLHIGDQFLSAGHNDFKARMAGTTVWVANPAETVACLDELTDLMENRVPE